MTFDPDEELLWVWCGNEGSAKLVGPFFTDAQVDEDLEHARCDHDHMTMRSTLRQMARRLPRHVRPVPALVGVAAILDADSGQEIVASSIYSPGSIFALHALVDLHRELKEKVNA